MTKISNQYSLTNVLFADAVNGRVGIGTASPTVPLDVVGAGRFSGALNGTSALFNSDFSSNETSKVGISFAGGYGQINSWGANTSTYGGLKFQISASNGGTINALTISPLGASTFSRAVTIADDTLTALTVGRYSAGIPIAYIKASSGSTGGFRLTNHNGSDVIVVNGSNNLTLDSPTTNITGNVGIGTDSPFVGGNPAKLQIKPATNINLAIQIGTADATGVKLNAFNDAASANIPMELNGSIMILKTAETERMRITSGGNVGIGNSNPSYKLDVNGEIVTRGAATAAYSYEDRNNTSIIYTMFAYAGYTNFYNGGNKAQINMSNGAYTALSDINKKKDFEQSNIGLNEVMQLKPTLYRMKTDVESSPKELGFIAQEVKEFIPQAYVENESQDDVFIGLNQMPIIAALTKAIQELSAQASEQQTQINELKALLNA